MRSIVVGVGNPLLGDDGIGIVAARMLKGRIKAHVTENTSGGLQLAETIADYDFAIIIDAIIGHDEGMIEEVRIDQFKESVANHDISFLSAIKLLGNYTRMPKIKILGIGIRNLEVKETLSEKVRNSIPLIATAAKKILEEQSNDVR